MQKSNFLRVSHASLPKRLTETTEYSQLMPACVTKVTVTQIEIYKPKIQQEKE